MVLVLPLAYEVIRQRLSAALRDHSAGGRSAGPWAGGDPSETLNLVCLLGFAVLGVLLVGYRLRLDVRGVHGAYSVVYCPRRVAGAWLLISAQFQIVLFVYWVDWGFVA
ncbi:MAG: hypothetical protein JO057_26395 [Chloroflexi bacterium]|nr:hypothetical protein [Chloroflexota bacterium]